MCSCVYSYQFTKFKILVFISLQRCSIFYTKRFCIACVESNMEDFPKEIQKVLYIFIVLHIQDVKGLPDLLVVFLVNYNDKNSNKKDNNNYNNNNNN